jgi:hypothetical protein
VQIVKVERFKDERRVGPAPNGPAPAASNRRRAWLIWCGLSAVFVLSALWRPPDEPSINLCPLRALAGCNCPGCGMTRAFCAIARGELWRAARFNALSPFLFAAAITAWAGALARILNLQSIAAPLSRLAANPLTGRLTLALFGAWWIVRLAVGV